MARIFIGMGLWAAVCLAGDPVGRPASGFEPSNTAYRFVIQLPLRRGGYGDIASNLMVMRQLREKYPNASMTLLYDPEDAKMKALIPGLEPTLPEQIIEGVVYRHEGLAPPTSDFLLSFSRPSDKFEYPAAGASFLRLSADEFADSTPFISVIGTPEEVRTFNFGTGAKGLGFYVLPRDPEFQETRAEFYLSLRKSVPALPEDGSKVLLAATYTFNGGYAGGYLTYLAELGRDPKYKDRTIAVLIPRHHQTAIPDFEFPPNVKPILYDALPMSLHSQLIMRTDFPPLVTGDGTLSVAIQAGKPFFYETPYWKERSAVAFLERLVHDVPGWDPKTLAGVLKGEGSRESMVRFLKDEAAQAVVQQHVVELRNSSSLIEKLVPYLEVMSSVDGDQLSRMMPSDLEYLMRLIERLEEANAVKEHLIAESDPFNRDRAVRILKIWHSEGPGRNSTPENEPDPTRMRQFGGNCSTGGRRP